MTFFLIMFNNPNPNGFISFTWSCEFIVLIISDMFRIYCILILISDVFNNLLTHIVNSKVELMLDWSIGVNHLFPYITYVGQFYYQGRNLRGVWGCVTPPQSTNHLDWQGESSELAGQSKILNDII
jgi:hypothetical protein